MGGGRYRVVGYGVRGYGECRRVAGVEDCLVYVKCGKVILSVLSFC